MNDSLAAFFEEVMRVDSLEKAADLRVKALHLFAEMKLAGMEALVTVTVPGVPIVRLKSVDYGIITGYAQAGEKIKAIKHLREVSGLGLKEAKDMVEGHYWGRH